MATIDSADTATGTGRGLGVELNALNPIPESERRGPPRSRLWPGFGAHVRGLGLS